MGLLWLAEKSEKRNLGNIFGGLARDKLLLPIAPLIASLVGIVRVWERHVEEGREVWACS